MWTPFRKIKLTQKNRMDAIRFFFVLIAANLLLNFTAESAILNVKGVDFMPNIKPISDLRNYTEVLRDVEEGSPVFLTKNGRGKYAILDMHDYEKAQATIRLMNEIAKGRRSGETEGWLSMEAVEESLGIANE
jgi:prevent-host-death family protein